MDITKSFEFKLPTRILFGVNLVESLGEEVKALDMKRLLLVTDEGVVNAGLLERVIRSLDASAIDYTIFASVEAAREAVFAVESLAADIGIPRDLKQMGADPARINDLAEETLNQKGALPFNPRKVGKPEVIQLFEQAFELSKRGNKP